MNTSLHEFMSEWGPILTALICLIGGFIHARMYCVGTPFQKTATYIAIMVVILACVLSAVFEIIPGEKMSRGLFVERILLGIPVPLLAGIGIFAWINPEKWVGVAENRKYTRRLREEK